MLTKEQEQKIVDELRSSDFDFWFKKIKVNDARKHLEKRFGVKIPPRKFVELRGGLQWWKIKPRPSPSRDSCLDNTGWEKLRKAINKLSHEIQGRSIGEAVAIISTIQRTNRSQLSGLRADMHVWKKD